MPEKPATVYQRLPGTGYRRVLPGWALVLLFFVIGIFVFLLRGRRNQLWTGDDHLLMVESDGSKELYRRYFYRDIQALVLRKTSEGLVVNLLLGVLVAGLISLAVAVADPVGTPLLGVLAALVLVLLLSNALGGPTCRCYLRTAVSSEELPSLNRLRQVRKALDRLRPLIAAAQGELAPEEITGRLLHQASGGVAPVETAPAPAKMEPPPDAAG